MSILAVLGSYGYSINDAGGHREQQFSCDLHGDGLDAKPSARVYPESSHWYCFACGTQRDAIQTVREKEGMNFLAALNALEQRYHLPPLPWEDEDRVEEEERPEEGTVTSPVFSVEEVRLRVGTLLRGLTKEKTLGLERTLQLWEEHDMLSSLIEASPEGLFDRFMSLRDRVIRLSLESQGALKPGSTHGAS